MTDQPANPATPQQRALGRMVAIAALTACWSFILFMVWVLYVKDDPADQIPLAAGFVAAAVLIPLVALAVAGRLRGKRQGAAVEAEPRGTWEYTPAQFDPMRAMLWLAFVVVMALGAFSEYMHYRPSKAPGADNAANQTVAAQPVPNAAASGAVAAIPPSPAEAEFRTSGGIATDGVNLYVADSRENRIRKIVIATGAETALAGSGARGDADGAGSAATFNYPTGVVAEGGNLYVADTANHRIRRIAIANGETTTLAGSGAPGAADGIGAAAAFNFPSGIATDGAALYVSDSNSRVIRKIAIATGDVTTLAGSGTPGEADGLGKAASFSSPRAIVYYGGNLYVADGEAGRNARIRKVSIATGEVATVAGTDANASLGSSIGMTTDGARLYLVDGRDNRVVAIALTTGAVAVLARGVDDRYTQKATVVASSGIATNGNNLFVGSGRPGGIDKIAIATGELSSLRAGAAATLDNPTALASDGNNLYVADSGNHLLRRIDLAAGTVSTLAGWEGKGIKDGKGTAALFNYPWGVASDGGNLYVADSNNNVIRKVVLATGEVSTLAGSGAPGAQDGVGAAASFNSPAGLAADGGNLYVADSDNHVIRKIELGSGAVTTLAGSGAAGLHDGTGKAASFHSPRAIVADRGNLYVADTYNNAVRKIVIANGAVTTLAGTGSQGATDAVGKAASFWLPSGIAIAGDAIYLADTNNHTIRKIALPGGAVTTVSGSGAPGTRDGSGRAAAFSHPLGLIAVGGNLYVADSQNARIRQVALATAAVSTVAGLGNPAADAASAVAAQPDVDEEPSDDPDAGRQ